MDCVICSDQVRFAWCDTHGVAQCLKCGAPYRIYHYEDDKRVDRPPSLLFGDDVAGRVRRFHAETGGRLSAVGMGLSFPGGYDVADRSDAEKWNEWAQANPEPAPGPGEEENK